VISTSIWFSSKLSPVSYAQRQYELDLKKKIVKCTIWSVVLYGAEIWTMTRADKERLEAFEMWIWRL